MIDCNYPSTYAQEKISNERNGFVQSGRLKSRCKLRRPLLAQAAWPIHEIWHASPVERENARNNAADARAAGIASWRCAITARPDKRLRGSGLTDSCINCKWNDIESEWRATTQLEVTALCHLLLRRERTNGDHANFPGSHSSTLWCLQLSINSPSIRVFSRTCNFY